MFNKYKKYKVPFEPLVMKSIKFVIRYKNMEIITINEKYVQARVTDTQRYYNVHDQGV